MILEILNEGALVVRGALHARFNCFCAIGFVGAALGAEIPVARAAGRGKAAVDLFATIPAMSDFPLTTASRARHGISE